MINKIGKSDYGLYTLAMSVISLFVFDFGLSVSITRFLAKYLAQGRKDLANKCLSVVYKLYFGLDVILLIILTSIYFFIPEIYQELSLEEIEKFKVIYSVASLYTLLSFPFLPLNGILSANECFIQLKLSELVHKFLVVGLMTICLINGMGLYALVTVNAIAGIVMIGIKLGLIKKYTAQRINWKYNDKKELKELLGFSGWVTIMSICQRSIFLLGPTILGIVSGVSAIAVFGIASTLEGYVFTFAAALSGMFLPRISRMIEKGESVLPLMIKVGRMQLIIVLLIVGGFWIVGKSFISMWVGNNFSESYICTLLIIIPAVLQLPQEIADQTLIANNKVKERSCAFLIMATVNICLGIPLAKYFGALGLSISIAIAYFLRTLVLNIIYKKILDLNLKKFFIEVYKPFLSIIIIMMGMNYLINTIEFGNEWICFMAKGLLYVTIYAFTVYLIVMNKEEKSRILNLIRRRL